MSRFAHVRAVLFDLDGTLVDSATDLGAAADRMRVARGLPSLAARSITGREPAPVRGACWPLRSASIRTMPTTRP
jgi:phosphoglycolate phosphatase-like HAD superfamily hydrolase